MNKTLLIVSQVDSTTELLKTLLKTYADKIFTSKTIAQAEDLLSSEDIRVVLSVEEGLPTETLMAFSAKLKTQSQLITNIILSEYANFNEVKSAMLQGSVDTFIATPWDNHVLTNIIKADLLHVEFKRKKLQQSIVVTDAENKILSTNYFFEKITGYKQSEVLNQHVGLLLHQACPEDILKQRDQLINENGHWHGKLEIALKNKLFCPIYLTANVIFDDQNNIVNYIYTFFDNSDEIAFQQTEDYKNSHDELTGFLTTEYFQHKLTSICRKITKKNHQCSLVIICIDEFGQLPAKYGDDAAREILSSFAKRLETMLQDNEVIARLRDDHIAILAPLIKQKEVVNYVEKLQQLFKTDINIGEEQIQLSASIGFATYPNDANNIEDFITKTYAILNYIKQFGVSTNQFHDSPIKNQIDFIKQLHSALSNNEFVLHFSPFIDITTSKVSGVLGLVYWNHPNLGLLSPIQYFPSCDDTHLVIELEKFLIRQACQMVSQWRQALQRDINLHFDLSIRHLLPIQKHLIQQGIAEFVSLVSHETGMKTKNMFLELNFSEWKEDVDQFKEITNTLHTLGLNLVLDDFSAMFAPIDLIKECHYNILRLDVSFIDDLTTINNILDFVKSLDMTIIAIEASNEKQIEFLRHHNCERIQGPFYCKPLTQNAMFEFIKKH